MIGLKDHHVICNWTAKTLPLIRQLRSDLLQSERRVIVVVTRKEIDPSFLLREQEKLGSGEGMDDDGFLRDVFFFPGDPTDIRVLQAVSVEDAHCVLVLAEEDLGEAADARTLLTLFALRAIEAAAEQSGRTVRINTVAEITSAHNYHKFRTLEEDAWKRMGEDGRGFLEVVRAESLQTRILAQAARTPGLVSFYSDLLAFSEDTNEIYHQPIPEPIRGNYRTFSALSEALLDREISDGKGGRMHILPIGIFRKGTFLLSPTKEEEQLEEGDHLVFIAPSLPPEDAWKEL